MVGAWFWKASIWLWFQPLMRNGLANKVNKLKKFDLVHQTVSHWETVAGQMGGQGSYRRSNGWAGQLQKVKWVSGAVAEGQMGGRGSYRRSNGWVGQSQLLFCDIFQNTCCSEKFLFQTITGSVPLNPNSLEANTLHKDNCTYTLLMLLCKQFHFSTPTTHDNISFIPQHIPGTLQDFTYW